MISHLNHVHCHQSSTTQEHLRLFVLQMLTLLVALPPTVPGEPFGGIGKSNLKHSGKLASLSPFSVVHASAFFNLPFLLTSASTIMNAVATFQSQPSERSTKLVHLVGLSRTPLHTVRAIARQ